MNKVFFEMEHFVDAAYANLEKDELIDHTKVSKLFEEFIEKKSDQELINTLIYTGFIPDTYKPDSTEETLYTKLCEVIVSSWANRMGFVSEYIVQKSSYQDVDIIIKNKIIVCDTKSFRLSRSQKAPNVKDFVKPEDYRKWLERHNEDSRLGGLIVYPSRHDWSSSSDTYQYCSDKNNPIVILPYQYLAYFLQKKITDINFDPNVLVNIWDYERIFPEILDKSIKGGNKKHYWESINAKIIELTNDKPVDFYKFLNSADKLIDSYIVTKIEELEGKKLDIIKSIQDDINNMPDDQLRKILIENSIEQNTKDLTIKIDRIKKFRL